MAIVSNRPPNDPMIRRDRALLLLGWAGAMRASDLVALNVEDLTFAGDPDRGDGGMLLRLHQSETDQEQRGASIAVTYSQRIGSCPVRSTMLLARDYRTGPLSVDASPQTPSPTSSNAMLRTCSPASTRPCSARAACGPGSSPSYARNGQRHT